MSEPMTPDPNEVLTVVLTAEQAEHVRAQLLADFASGLRPLARATCWALKDVRIHAALYAAKVAALDQAQPITYADRRCELAQLADDLLALGADLAINRTATDLERLLEHEAAARERVLQLAPAFTARAILDQLPGRDDR